MAGGASDGAPALFSLSLPLPQLSFHPVSAGGMVGESGAAKATFLGGKIAAEGATEEGGKCKLKQWDRLVGCGVAIYERCPIAIAA